MNDDDIKSLWQSQPASDYAGETGRFQRQVKLRDLQENIAALLAALFFAVYAWLAPEPFMRIGSGLIVLASFNILYQLRRHAMPPESLALPAVACLRMELVRQRDLLRGLWLWCMLPCTPGIALLLWGMAQPDPSQFPWQMVALMAVPFIVVIVMNHLTARKLQARIAQLDQA
ncbi:hypothetical protein [Duganella sp. S19_KUP01_CR8]|uniref:hypothetical protein n=1 Tax=Duganella sp. S19_KUP01_CR8 TaxID=3025502 RepID=UPI002FCDA24F